MRLLAGEHLCECIALVFRLVGEHRARDGVADGVDARHAGREMRVGLHAAALVERDADRVQPEARDMRPAADREQHHVGADRLGRAARGGFHLQRHASVVHRSAGYLRRQAELHPLLGQDAFELLAHLAIHAGQDAVQEFDDRHLRAEAAPDAAHLEPDHAAADHHQVVGHGIQLERAGGGDDALLIHLDTAQGRGFRTRGDDDVLRGVVGARDLHGARRGNPPLPLQPGHLVLLEKELDALDVGGDDLRLACLHLREVERDLPDADAMLSEVLAGFLEHFRGMQQGLGRDAADVEAGAAQRLALFHAGHLHAELRGTDGADIAARTGADHDDVEGFGHGSGILGLKA